MKITKKVNELRSLQQERDWHLQQYKTLSNKVDMVTTSLVYLCVGIEDAMEKIANASKEWVHKEAE